MPEAALREAIVEVTLADGTQLNEWVKDVRGTAENPMTREEVVAKARDLITPVLGAAPTYVSLGGGDDYVHMTVPTP